MVVAEREERIVPLQSCSKTINELLRHPFVRDIYDILNRILAFPAVIIGLEYIPIDHIYIGHDDGGIGAAWFLDCGVFGSPAAGFEQTFDCME